MERYVLLLMRNSEYSRIARSTNSSKSRTLSVLPSIGQVFKIFPIECTLVKREVTAI